MLCVCRLDYEHYINGSLEKNKLPTRHPLNPFWVVQFRMIPLVLYNQLVVWPLVYLILLWPIWSKTHLSESEWSSRYGIWTLPPAWLALAIISDQMWYWSHRLMHGERLGRGWYRESLVGSRNCEALDFSMVAFIPQNFSAVCLETLSPYAPYC